MKCAGRITVFIQVLPGASLHVHSGLLVGPTSIVLRGIRLFLNVTKQAGFRSRSCGIGRLAKFYGDSDYENDNCNDSI